MSKTRPVFISAAGLAAVGAASWLPDSEGPGVFLLIVASLSLLGLFGASAIPRKPANVALAILALGLVALSTIRTAAWIVLPALVMAAGLVVVSISRSTSWLSMFLTGLKPIFHIAAVPRFIIESAGLNRKMDPDGTMVILRTGAAASLLLVVFGALFASADRAFAEILERLSPDWDLGLLPARMFIFVFVMTASSALALTGLKLSEGDEMEPRRLIAVRIRFIEWFVPLLMLDLLFVTFVAVQFTVLFGGHDLVLRTAGLTYAEYAREGFAQLLVAAGLSLAVVCTATSLSATETARSRLILKGLLGTLCVLTLVILFSALKRLGLYEEAFGYTRARLAGHAVSWWLAGIFALTLVAGAISSTRWLARSMLAYTALAMLLFAVINPENLIARENLERAERTGKVDIEYLLTLGPDAVPAFISHPERSRLRSCILWQQRDALEEEAWSDFNWSRHRARALLQKEPLRPVSCEGIGGHFSEDGSYQSETAPETEMSPSGFRHGAAGEHLRRR